MKWFKYLFLISLSLFFLDAFAQKIVYSEPDKDETRRMNFEVIGKVGGNFMIYKNIRGKNFISSYDNDMQQIAKAEHDYLPEDRLINVDFFPYTDHAYMIYQYQRRNVVYCNAVKLDAMGKKVGDIMELDTTHISFTTNNKIYSTINSDDKSKIMLFKINSRNRSRFLVTTLLFDDTLALKKRSRLVMPMSEREDFLDEFSLDNEGDLVFTKLTRNSNDNVTKTFLIWKPAMSDSFSVTDLGLEKIYLDDLQLKVDNANKRYFLSSFYYKERRGNIEGLYFFVWDKTTQKKVMENTQELKEELRREAKGESNIKMAFNDYFIRNIIVKRDGGFVIGSEAYYTSSRYNNWNRFNYLYGAPSVLDYYSYSPLYNSWYWRNRFNTNQSVRHHADNVAILSFDNTGKLEWSNVIHKEQFDDESDDHISYQLINTGGQLHFVFNQEEKRAQLLNDYTVSPDGQINRNPTLKNLDKGYEFLPKYGKQVSNRQVIIPCYYRNYICFAKLDYNS
ncbi:MAG TPA: hypothetical protein VNA26_05465 [Chitinophagaceae bacterium]|nr:hypothetical protein [Chitinophagaceae bacterium]